MNVNTRLQERIVSRALTLERVKAGEVTALRRLLQKLERDLVRDLHASHLTTWRQNRYERLLVTVRETIRRTYRALRDTNAETLTEVAGLESQWTTRALNQTMSEPLGTYIPFLDVAVSPQQLRAIARNTLIDNAPSANWWSMQATDVRQRFARTVKAGLLRGQPTPEIARLIRDEVMPVTTRNAEALVRTSISAVLQEARLATYKEHAPLIASLTWSSQLDGKTTIEFCIPRAGKLYTLDGEPIGHTLPWDGGPGVIHWNCRSQIVSNLKSWSELAGRTINEGDDRTLDDIFRQKLRDRGWNEDRIATAQRNMRSSMDGFVPREITFTEWLTRKGAAFQDEALGKGRADLFRRGLMTDVSQLVSGTGAPLTLRQLRQQIGGA